MELRKKGYESYGCDLWGTYGHKAPELEYLKEITTDPYRLPFSDGFFDVVISTSVFEHAQNKTDCMHEIHRVLREGGISMHLFPSKWRLFVEPHIKVPLVSWLWPFVPKWWLILWAFIGVRNEFQKAKNWREVSELNYKYCKNGLSYWSTRRYYKMSLNVFGNCSFPMEAYIQKAPGGFARLARQLPFRKLWGFVSREFRVSMMLQKKQSF
jgi:SAM-dependent methyltransferase